MKIYHKDLSEKQSTLLGWPKTQVFASYGKTRTFWPTQYITFLNIHKSIGSEIIATEEQFIR